MKDEPVELFIRPVQMSQGKKNIVGVRVLDSPHLSIVVSFPKDFFTRI